MKLAQLIEHAARHLPPAWAIRIDIEQGYGEVIVIHPNESEVPMSDGESDITAQFKNALDLIKNDYTAPGKEKEGVVLGCRGDDSYEDLAKTFDRKEENA